MLRGMNYTATPAASTARHQRAPSFAEFTRQREEEGGRDFALPPCVAQIADGIAWMQATAPFAVLGPGPYWTPKPLNCRKISTLPLPGE
jgi:hypothetical protein